MSQELFIKKKKQKTIILYYFKASYYFGTCNCTSCLIKKSNLLTVFNYLDTSHKLNMSGGGGGGVVIHNIKLQRGNWTCFYAKYAYHLSRGDESIY